jgi:UDPglucose 6-dehydrogenase
MKPDRVIVGVEDDRARELMEELYAPYNRKGNRIIFMDIPSAEVTKYAANAMLATRISFMNQIAALCERVGADVAHVRHGIGSDQRIGSAFLYPGPAGGSLSRRGGAHPTAREQALPFELLEAVEKVNERQKRVLLEKIDRLLGPRLAGHTIGVWGLAFKAETDDMRESPAIPLIEGLLERGATVLAHDPHAMDTARALFDDRITYARDPYAAAHGASALV